MYLINYDLYDLHALIVFFRNSPERFPAYTEALSDISAHVCAKTADDTGRYNAVRNILRKYSHGDGLLTWYMVNNVMASNTVVIRNEGVYGVISAIFCEMMEFYDDIERFVLLCDAVHNVPIILADESMPAKTVEIMIKEYRHRYNRQFLKRELKDL